MRAARQQRGEFRFAAINRIHVPIALASMLLLLRPPGCARRSADLGTARQHGDARFANAVVCGVFANPHDRYGARLVWLAPLVVLLCRLMPGAVSPQAAAGP